MLVTLALPQVGPLMTGAEVIAVHAAEGQVLVPGAKLLDLSVDLSGAVEHDCPPVSSYRIALRERLWLRRLLVADGQALEIGAPLAILTTEPDSPLDEPEGRAARVTMVGIISEPDWWDEPRP